MSQRTLRPALALLFALDLAASMLVILTPSANALPNGNDPWQQEIWRQAVPSGFSSSYTCGPCPSTGTTGTATLPAGDYYVVVNAGCNSCSGPFSYTLNGVGVVTWNNDGSMTLGSVGASVSAYQFLQWGGCSTACYADLAVTLSATVTLSFNGFNSFGMGNCGFGCSYGGGTLSTNALTGWGFVGGFWTGYSGAQNYHAMWFSASSRLSEAGILASQMTRTPTGTQWTWSQIQGDTLLINAANSAGGTTTNGGAASFTADLTKGRFIDTTAMRWAVTSPGCSATVSFAISRTLAYPWNVSAEIANLTATMTQGATSGTALVTVDWSNAKIAADAAYAFGTPVASAGGAVVGPPFTTGQFYSSFPPSLAAGGTYYFHWNIQQTGGTCAGIVQFNAGNPYTGGDLWTDGGTAWTEQLTQDPNQWIMNVYGGAAVLYTLNEAQKDVGGAGYLYLCEVQRDALPQRYTLSTSYGGAARVGSYQAGGSTACSGVTGGGQQETIQEWRLGYEQPVNASQSVTLTLDASGASRNLLYVGTLAGTQPPHANLAGIFSFTATGYNPVTFYKLFSTDDYATNATFTVLECADTACGTFGAAINTSNYVATICPGVFARVVAGVVNASAMFNVSGQDLAGCKVQVDLKDATHAPTSWTVTIPGPGSYTYTLGMLLPTTAGGNPTLLPVVVTFSGNFTRVVPDKVNLSINRTLPTPLWVDQVLFDLKSGSYRRVGGPALWAGTDAGTFTFLYPTLKSATEARDAGTYEVFLTDGNGTWIAGHTYCILATWDATAAGACNVPIQPSDQTKLAQDSAAAIQQAQVVIAKAHQAQIQQQAVDYYASFLAFCFESDFGIPNFAMWLMWAASLFAFGIARGR